MGIILLIIGSFAVLQATAFRECDNLGVLVYEDMKCQPQFNNNSKCPSSYKCSDIKQSEDTCYFKGSSTKIGERFKANTFCDIGCSCTRGDVGMEFSCAILECGQYGPPPPKDCYFSYTLDKCCGGMYCPPKDHQVHKCKYDGKEYREGERFFPKDSCSMCLCKEGFKGKVEEPFCVPRQCDGQIKHQAQIQKYCAPIYNRKEDIDNGILCCPNLYACPDGNEAIEGEPTSSLECRYGNKTVKVGQGFKKEVKEYFKTHKVSCKCKIPPLLTCITEN